MNKISDRLVSSEEFCFIFDKLFNVTCSNFFSDIQRNNLSIFEYKKLLSYCDLLSSSTIESHRELSIKIITMLYNLYFSEDGYQLHLKSIFTKFGLFSAEASFIDKPIELPNSIQIVREFKRSNQQVKSGDILTDAQFNIYENISEKSNFSFSGPTSIGKSFLLKHTAIRLIEKANNIVFILPTKALLDEYQIDIRRMLLSSESYNINVAKSVSSFRNDKKNILILTQERLNSFIYDKELKDVIIDVLIVDEAHKLSDVDSRSVTLFKVISKSLDRFKKLRVYFASPVINNPEIYLDVFGIDSDQSYLSIKESPVTQSLFVVNTQDNSYRSFNPRTKLFDTQKIVANITGEYSLISYLGSKSKSNLVYSSSKSDAVKRAEEFRDFLIREGVDIQSDQELANESNIIKSLVHEDYVLPELLKAGIAYHHGNLPSFIRKRVEELYANKKLKYVFCTSTLLEGVNLPTENIFIYPIYSRSKHVTVKNKLNFWNLAGRAGRYKNELNGNIICLGGRSDWSVIDEYVSNDKQVAIENPINETFSKHRMILNIFNDKNKDPKKVIREVSSIVLADIMQFKINGKKTDLLDIIPKKYFDEVVEAGWDYACRNKLNTIDLPSYSSNHRITTEQHQLALISVHNNRGKLNSLARDDVKVYISEINAIYKIRKSDSSLGQLFNVTYSWLMGNSLSQILKSSIKYSTSVRISPKEYVEFDKDNKKHINLKINEIIYSIEQEVCFELEMYCNHYFQLYSSVKGENNAGINLAKFLEYGTMDLKVISLQDFGFSRAAALEIVLKAPNSLRFDSSGSLIELNKILLTKVFDFSSVVHKELRWVS